MKAELRYTLVMKKNVVVASVVCLFALGCAKSAVVPQKPEIKKGSEHAAVSPSTPPTAPLDCSQTMYGNDMRYTVVDAESPRRAGQAFFSKVESSPEAPVEVCTVRSQLDLLMRLRCDDGSLPFDDLDHAHGSRAGNVGGVGRCDHIVDLYTIPCPEKSYDLYLDSYMCLASEVPRDSHPYQTLHLPGVDVPVLLDWTYFERTNAPLSVTLTPQLRTGVGAILKMWHLPHAEAASLFQTEIAGVDATIPMPVLDAPPKSYPLPNKTQITVFWHSAPSDTRLIMLLAPQGATLTDHAADLLPELVDAFEKNTQKEVEWSSLLTGEQKDLTVEINVKKQDDRLWYYPAKWKVLVKNGSLGATLGEGSQQIRFAVSAEPMEALSVFNRRRLNMQLIDGQTVITMSDNGAPNDFRVVRSLRGYRSLFASIVQDGMLVTFLLHGPEAKLAEPGYYYALFEALVAANTNGQSP